MEAPVTELPSTNGHSDSTIAIDTGPGASQTETPQSGAAPATKVRSAGGRKRVKATKAKGLTKRTPTADRPRVQRTFPASTFEEALPLAEAIQQFAAGQRVRRATLFGQLDRSADSGPSRQLVTNSSKYGLTTGSYKAEYLELTPDGQVATNAESRERDRLKAQFRLAVESIPAFKQLYDELKEKKLPQKPVLQDFLQAQGMPGAETSECVETFILNAKFLGLLRTISGAEKLISIEHALDTLPAGGNDRLERGVEIDNAGAGATVSGNDWSKICFYVTPIGEDDSEQRRHSDLFLSALVEPALEEFGLHVIRADQIGKPGMITAQVIEHVLRARIVIADLSYHNPNVFYELSLRHATQLPAVQIIRAADQIPFDLNQFRTVQIDTTSIYTLVPRLETYKTEIAGHVRRALEQPGMVDNPLTVFMPGLKVSVVIP